MTNTNTKRTPRTTTGARRTHRKHTAGTRQSPASDQRPEGKRFGAEMFEPLASIGCTEKEIADVLGFSLEALRLHGDAIERGRAELRLKLRWWQWQAARAGDTAMLIHLGKQFLGQRDGGEREVTDGPAD